MRQPRNRPALMLPSERTSQRSLAYGPGSMRRVGEWWHTRGLGNEAHSEDSHSQRLDGLAGDFTYMGKKMIVFKNAGVIDVRSISTFGVSVKEGKNPIGFFGTGLKYAIAVLLRTGHKVTIHAGLDVIRFGISSSAVRGQDFDFVTMQTNDGPVAEIGFTTELGKGWELWMAYREIACNCKDEDGDGSFEFDAPEPEDGNTTIIVEGAGFESIFGERHNYILEDEPMFMMGNIEVRNRPGADFYYRGVRVMQHHAEGIYLYNDTEKLELTEDRTAKCQYTPRIRIARAIMRCDNKSFLRAVITAGDKTLEGNLDFHGYGVVPSEAFLEVCGSLIGDRMTKMNPSACRVWQDATKRHFEPREIALTAVQQKSMEKALDFCAQIGFQIRGSYPIKVVESLGEGTLGLAHEETIFIAERVFQLGGTKQLASTLIEEYLHLRHGWLDMSRELQSFLFEKLVSVGEELVGEPL
jgi:hypothetical protein